MAIQGDWSSVNYLFNSKGTPHCPSNGSISDIGMIIDGDMNFKKLTIVGVTYLPHISFEIKATPGACQIYSVIIVLFFIDPRFLYFDWCDYC